MTPTSDLQTGLRAGDPVIAGTYFGGYASHVTIPARQVFKLPPSVDLEHGAALPVNYFTAQLALFEMAPDVFLRTTTAWNEPKVAFRMAGIDVEHLGELVTEAWRVQAPRYLRRELEELGDS